MRTRFSFDSNGETTYTEVKPDYLKALLYAFIAGGCKLVDTLRLLHVFAYDDITTHL